MQQRSGYGRRESGNGHHLPARRPRPSEEPAGRWAKVARTIRGTVAGVPRVLAMVWKADRKLTVLMAVMTIAQAAIPASQVYLAKLLIDAVVKAIRHAGGAVDTKPIVVLAVLQLVIAAASSSCRSACRLTCSCR